jgi:hypothetical protein
VARRRALPILRSKLQESRRVEIGHDQGARSDFRGLRHDFLLQIRNDTRVSQLFGFAQHLDLMRDNRPDIRVERAETAVDGLNQVQVVIDDMKLPPTQRQAVGQFKKTG